LQNNINTKLNILPKVDDPTDPGFGWEYHIPYNFEATPDAEKLNVTLKTLTLDNKVTKMDFNKSLPAVTTTTAGLMTAADKVALDGKAKDDEVVKLTGNQIIDGSKEFKQSIHFENGLASTVYGFDGVTHGEAMTGATTYKFPTLLGVENVDVAYTGYVDSALASKQDTINDLETIREGAALGATAIQSHQDISGKLNVLPKVDDPTDPGFGWEYHIPYRFDVSLDAEKANIDLHTLTLDNKVTKMVFNKQIPGASQTTAGLMTAADKVALESKQDSLTAGKNITITDNVIKANSEFITLSGTSGTLTDEQLAIISDNTDAYISLNSEVFRFSSVVSGRAIIATYSNSSGTNGDVILVNVVGKTWEYKTNQLQPKLTAGDNITIDANNVISASSGSSYSAGNGINITDNTISTKLGRGLKHTDDGEITIKPADTTISVGEFGVRVPYVSTSLDNTSSGLAVKLADNSIEAYNSGTGTKGIRVNTNVIQPKISDIEIIRTNASNGATALSNMNGIKLLALTKAEYEALTTKEANTLYIIKKA